jgi:hypothetical protein
MTTRKGANNDIHNTTQKDMQYNDHKKEQTMIYITLHRRNHCLFFLVVIVLHVLLCSVMYIIVCSLSCGHCIACPSV